MVDMRTLTINGVQFEVVDADTRAQMELVLAKIEELGAKKDFVSVEFDNDTRYLHFLDETGTDVYDPVLIEGGGGGGSVVSSVVKLINQNGTSTITVASGSKVELLFNFTSTENDIPTGNGSCQISVNGNVKTTYDVEQGNVVADVTKYLNAGTNNVRVKCTDIYGNYRMLVYTVSVVDIYVTSTFDATVPYAGDITFKYTPYGALEKTIHICVDGDELTANTTATSGKQITQIIPAMTHGIHTIEVYVTATLEDVPLESDHLIYDVICTEENNTTPMIASAYGVETVTQGEQVSIPYIVYDPTKLACDITLSVYTMSNGSEIVFSTQNITVDRSQQYWNTRKYPIGTVYFRIKYGDVSKVHTLTVNESKIDIETETNDLELYLSSEGRSNNEPNPAVWSYGSVSTTFENVNWDTTGWVNDAEGDACLRLNGEAKAAISFQPFAGDIRTQGKTIELEFAVRDVNNRNAVLMTCMSGGIGFEVTADTARIVSEQSNVFCKYKDEEKVRLAFVVESRSEHRALSIYLNGVLSDVIQYPDNDNFQQKTPVNITIGSKHCGVDVYTIRSYTTALSSPTAVNNFIADMNDIADKTITFENNDIYDEYGNISFEKCKKKNSVMVIVGTLPESKGDKKIDKVIYYDLENPSISYTEDNVEVDVQGTSSQWLK